MEREKRPECIEVHMNGVYKGIDPTIPKWARQPEKPKYTPEEVGAPTTEQFDALAEKVENIPEWARQPEKPKYTPEEVGAPTTAQFSALSKEVDDLPQWARQPEKPKYTPAEVGSPTTAQFSALSKEVDDLPQWARQPEKPKYTPEEVGSPTTAQFSALSKEVDDLPQWARQPEKPKYTPEEVDSVSYKMQHLTDAEKAQARGNISAAGAIVCSATGENIEITDSSAQTLHGLKIFGKSTQSGTPTPNTPTPITSIGDKGEVNVKITGKNLFTPATKDVITFALQYKPKINLQAGTYTLSFNIKSTDTDSTQRRVSIKNIDDVALKYLYAIDGNNALTFTVSEPVGIIEFCASNSNGNATGDTATLSNVMLNEGPALSYEPYTEQTINIPTPNGLLGVPTADGKWISDEIDYERGVRIHRTGKIDSYAGESVGEVWISSTGALSTGATVVYQLAEPIETPLTEEELNAYRATHTNKPNTIVSNDEGAEMEVSYAADTKMYIDNKFAELSAAILNNA